MFHISFDRFNASIQEGPFSKSVDFEKDGLAPARCNGGQMKMVAFPGDHQVQADPVTPEPAVAFVDTYRDPAWAHGKIAAVFIRGRDAAPGDVLVQVVEQGVKVPCQLSFIFGHKAPYPNRPSRLCPCHIICLTLQ